MKKILKYFVIVAVSVLFLTACTKANKSQPELSEERPKEVEQEQGKEEEEEIVQFTAPFTGVPLEEENDMRPVLVTINNDPKARPQSGLSEADIIYELITEGDMTRYLALFQTNLPSKIGPVRSARDMFIQTAKGLDAFYVAHGYSPDALELLQSGTIDHVNGMQHDGTLFKRSAERYAPHNSYITGDNILLAAEQIDAPMTMSKDSLLSFHESVEDVKVEEQATLITVQNGLHPLFTSVYTYDTEKGLYTQSINDVQTVDEANEQTVEISNIIVLEANHQTVDEAGRQSIDLKSGGEALLFQAGNRQEVEWENRNGMLVAMENGVPAKLVPGTTWVHIIRTTPGIDEKVSSTP